MLLFHVVYFCLLCLCMLFDVLIKIVLVVFCSFFLWGDHVLVVLFACVCFVALLSCCGCTFCCVCFVVWLVNCCVLFLFYSFVVFVILFYVYVLVVVVSFAFCGLIVGGVLCLCGRVSFFVLLVHVCSCVCFVCGLFVYVVCFLVLR